MLIAFLYLITLGIIAFGGLVLVRAVRSRTSIARSLNITLFRIRLPRIEGAELREDRKPKDEKELISVMEQLYSAFAHLHVKGWNRYLYGEPYVALELAVHHVGEETHFYIAVPKTYTDIFQKQIHGLYPTADVAVSNDYNIFNPNGATAGGYLRYTRDSVLSIKTYRLVEADPIGAVLTSMSKLAAQGEGVAFQLLIRPSHNTRIRKLAVKVAREMNLGHQFGDAMWRAKHPPRKKTDQQNEANLSARENPKTVTPEDQEVIKSIAGKASKSLFDTNLRLIASAPTELRAEQILKDFEAAFAQYSSPDLNGLSLRQVTGHSLDTLVFNFSFRLFNRWEKLVMSSEELTSLYHFPIHSTAAPKVAYLRAKPAEPPPNLPQDGIVIGENVYRGQRASIRLSPPDRQRHLYIIGQTGTGKTVSLKSMVRQDLEEGHGVCVIDPHGDLADFALSVVPPARAGDVIFFDPGDVERPLGLNMLEVDPSRPEQKTFIANELLEIIKSLYKNLPEAFGPMFEQYFKNAVLLLLDDYGNEIPTLTEIPRVLSDDDYRRKKLSRETNPLVKNFWELEAEKAGGEAALANMVPYITSKLNPFLANDYVRPIVGQQKSAFNFRELMDAQKILIVKLSKGRIGDVNANLLGMIIVGKLLLSAFSRVDMDESLRKDFYLYIDEFQNFTTSSIGTILSEARKYRLDLIVAHQFIKQLPEPIRDAVFGNVGSMMVFRISPDDAEFMKNKFDPVFTPQDLINIDNLNAYVSLLIGGQTVRPFNVILKTDRVFGAGDEEAARVVKEHSRLMYGRPLTEVEQEIRTRLSRVPASADVDW